MLDGSKVNALVGHVAPAPGGMCEAMNRALRDSTGQGHLAVLRIWGREDVSFPDTNHVDALKYMPHAQLATVESAAHLPQYEQPGVVNAAVPEWLGSH